MVKQNKAYLSKLEDVLAEGGFVVRYEKGNFKSGFCVLKETKIVLINNFLPVEGRATCLLELVGILPLAVDQFSEKSKKIFFQIKNSKTELPEIEFGQEPHIN